MCTHACRPLNTRRQNLTRGCPAVVFLCGRVHGGEPSLSYIIYGFLEVCDTLSGGPLFLGHLSLGCYGLGCNVLVTLFLLLCIQLFLHVVQILDETVIDGFRIKFWQTDEKAKPTPGLEPGTFRSHEDDLRRSLIS